MTITLRKTKSKFDDLQKDAAVDTSRLIIRSDGKKVGHIEAFEVDHRAAQGAGDFHARVGHLSQGFYNFLKALFERYGGKFRPKFYDGRPYQRGTGVFGRELDQADFIFLDEMVIESETDRRNGMGTATLARIHELYSDNYRFIFTWPAILNGYETAAVSRKEQIDRLVSFYRKSGYRRVGNTSYFAFATDPDHPSRRLSAAKDATGEPQSARPAADVPFAFPLHDRIIGTDPGLFDVIRDIDINHVHLQDDYGQTPLHYAAETGKFLAALSLLERSTGELFVRNAYGQTPLDVVEDRIAEAEETSRVANPNFQTVLGQSKEERVLEMFTRPLARLLREFMVYILDARGKGLSDDLIHNHIKARIAPERRGFLQRLRYYESPGYQFPPPQPWAQPMSSSAMNPFSFAPGTLNPPAYYVPTF